MGNGKSKNKGKTIKEACDGVLENVSFETVAIGAGVAGKTIKEACDGVLKNVSFETVAIGAGVAGKTIKEAIAIGAGVAGKTIKKACDGVLENVSFETVAIGAGVALAAVAIIRVFALFGSDSGSGSGRKTMKAPGRNDRIFRDVFESDPAKYFRDLRK